MYMFTVTSGAQTMRPRAWSVYTGIALDYVDTMKGHHTRCLRKNSYAAGNPQTEYATDLNPRRRSLLTPQSQSPHVRDRPSRDWRSACVSPSRPSRSAMGGEAASALLWLAPAHQWHLRFRRNLRMPPTAAAPPSHANAPLWCRCRQTVTRLAERLRLTQQTQQACEGW